MESEGRGGIGKRFCTASWGEWAVANGGAFMFPIRRRIGAFYELTNKL